LNVVYKKDTCRFIQNKSLKVGKQSLKTVGKGADGNPLRQEDIKIKAAYLLPLFYKLSLSFRFFTFISDFP
ncbi:hypothetical protein CGH39_26890, partial [Vibrio parahaemolyticus]